MVMQRLPAEASFISSKLARSPTVTHPIVTDLAKFEKVFKRYFDCDALQLPFAQKKMRKQRRKIRALTRENALVAGSFRRLRFAIESLDKTQERKSDKDLENLRPLMELFPMSLLGLPLTDAEVKIMAKHAQYVKVEPGTVVREHGAFSGPTKEGYNIILKGSLQLSIPDPVGPGLIESVERIEEEVHDATVIQQDVTVNKGVEKLSKAEFDALPPREQRRYKTRVMLQEILDRQAHETRPTTSLTNAIRSQATIDPRIRAAEPTQEELARKEIVAKVLERFGESLKKIVDPAIALREAGASMDFIKSMMSLNKLDTLKKPEDQSDHPGSQLAQSPFHAVESAVPKREEPESGAFITEKVDAEGDLGDDQLEPVDDEEEEDER
jgi:hypothetical protein